MLCWPAIEGQEQAVEILRRAACGRLAHAYLFTGPAGVGKRLAARTLAAALNCDGVEAARPCGRCLPCQQLEAGNYLGYREVAPENGSLRLQQVKETQNMLALSGEGGRYRVVVFDGAENLTTEAANALLKILEEPPENTVFILLTSRPAGVLPTVASRCLPVRFRPLPSAVVARLLVAGQDTTSELLAMLAQGSLDQARALAGDLARIGQARDAAFELWRQAGGSPTGQGAGQGINDAGLLLQMLGMLLRDEIMRRWPGAAAYVINRDLPGLPGGEDLPVSRLVDALDCVIAAELALQQNVNPQLLLEATLGRLCSLVEGD